MKWIPCIVLLLAGGGLFAQQPTADYILQKIDDNQNADSRIISSRMIIHGRRGSRTIESKSWIEGDEKSFTEYLAPAREKGTKMLKLGDDLWTYSPSTDRIIRISGHMLRQSVMGSDLSYEDMMEDHSLVEMYKATIIGSERIDDRDCWIIELTAKNEEVAYYARKIWVDRERYNILREDRFGKSGRLLKTTTVSDVRMQDGRWVAGRIVFKDVLKNGEGTEFLVDSVEFNRDIPAYLFSKAALKK
ncbi:outer membrane lipoprotein-sorting protein [bacterium]|nr:outer membrane lipoprotein-sorting protein [bacterium]